MRRSSRNGGPLNEVGCSLPLHPFSTLPPNIPLPPPSAYFLSPHPAVALQCAAPPSLHSYLYRFLLCSRKKAAVRGGKQATCTRGRVPMTTSSVLPPSLPILRPSPPTPPSTRVLACTFRGGGECRLQSGVEWWSFLHALLRYPSSNAVSFRH